MVGGMWCRTDGWGEARCEPNGCEPRYIYVDYVWGARTGLGPRCGEGHARATCWMRRISGEVWRWESGVGIPPLAEGGGFIHR